ncbi:MAG: site-2 protease family protein [Acidobacteriaceae bacterium]|nr:site-2 protease family protein [Acidobacteriaceae bacterium]
MSDTQFAGRLASLRAYSEPFGASRPYRRWWLHVLLLVLTLLTTTVFGFAVANCFLARRPFDPDLLVVGYIRLGHLDRSFWTGLAFSGPLLLILLAHELGHYLACRIWRVDATLPYFLPSPTLLGTFGAFIRIRSPIYSRKSLFDIGASGPLAGFAVLLPLLFVGVSKSWIVPNIALRSPIWFGTPLIMRLAERLRFGSISPAHIALHPLAVASWAGLLATAINLLPVGQLDGGHIVYAAFGARWHRRLSLMFIGILVAMGFFYWPWWVWAVAMFFLGRRHPLVYDRTPLPRRRMVLAALAFVLLVFSISIVPVSIK